MAQQCPASVDVTDIQFKLQSKHKVFAETGKLRDHVNLLACASNHGLLFVGNPNVAEILAFILPDVIYAKSTGQPVHLRTHKLASTPNTIACNADGSMLAVNYTLQGYGVLEIYHVPSFAVSDIKTLYSIRFPDQNVYALQILWNPVLSPVIGVVLSNGNFLLYTLKDGGAMDMRSLTNQQIQCGCWSPKGKQIVLGHPYGKLQQFKPDLTPVKSIVCPPNVHPGPFDTIALHWLSTFQFVVSYLQHGEGTLPTMYVVNAPKGGVPAYINYNDVCYSGSEPRKQLINFMHIAQWNLLLVTSANGVEIGLLGTKDSTDQPQWVHYMLLDEARIEMPLTEASDETYPIGLALDTSPVHELTVGEKKLQAMPVVHVLSTNGNLLCFNFLNLMPNAVGICSPPSPKNYALSKFNKLDEQSFTNSNSSQNVVVSDQSLTLPPIEAPPPAPAFSAPPQKSAINQNMPTFGTAENKSLFAGGWEQKPNQTFGGAASVNFTQRNVINKSSVQTAPVAIAPTTTKPSQSTEAFKPLYTVSPEFAPPPIQPNQQQTQQSQQVQDTAGKSKAQLLNVNETNSVIQQMIAMQITAFEKEIKQLGQKAKTTLNEDLSIMKSYSKRLMNLQEIIVQANERDFVMDVQDLRHSLTESYEMLNECRSKLRMYKNPDEVGVKYLTIYDCISQRQLKGLQNYLAINQSMMKNLEQQMDAQWSYYQDMVRRNSKYHMRIPCLDGIYQQMTKLKNLITQQQTKLHYIKSVIKQKELGRLNNDWHKDASYALKSDGGISSLADSILSISINNMTDTTSNKLPEDKLNALRNFTKQQGKITIIKPQRPNRVKLTSEVILETKQLIKRKETKTKNAPELKEEKLVTTFKSMQTHPKQITQTYPLSKSTSSNAPFANLQQNISAPAKDASAPPPELLKFGANTKTVKSAAIDVKPQTNVAPNKTQFSVPNSQPKSDPIEMGKSNSSNIFNVASKGFVGFGQQATNSNSNNLFNNANIINDYTNNNNTQKTFSFGNAFSSFTEATKTYPTTITQNTSGLPSGTTFAAQTPTVSLTTMQMQPMIFNKQVEKPTLGSVASPFRDKSAPGLSKASTDSTPVEKSEDTPALQQSLANTSTQNQNVADAAILKSLNICKPIVKEATKTKEGNVFSFNTNNENIPQFVLQPTLETSIPSSVSKGNAAISATITPSSTSSFFGNKGATTSTPTFPLFSATSINVPSPIFSSSITNTPFTATTTTKATTPTSNNSIVSPSSGASAFSFTNSTLFKNVAPFQSQITPTTGNTSTVSTSAVSTPFSTSSSQPAIAYTMPTVGSTEVTTSTTISTPTTSVAAAPRTSTSINSAPTTAATVTTVAPTAAPIDATTSPFFSAIAATKAPTDSLFSNTSQTSPTAASKIESVMSPTSTNISAFGNISLGGTNTVSDGGSIFGNTSGSGFASPIASGIFSAATTTVMPTSPTGTTGGGTSSGSIFGGTSAANNSTSVFGKPAENTTGSIFGNAVAKSPENSGSSLFGGTGAKGTESVNIFGSPSSPNTAVSSGSLFGQSALGQSAGSIFAAAASATNKPESTTSASGFSFVGSAFGSASKNTVATGSSLFGGNGQAATDLQQPQSNIFGSPTSGFGATATTPFSSFPQGSTAVANTGFGSPTQQQQAGAFSRPVFGGAPTFGSPPPAFGSQPSFGGAPTFGSPKGFGSFATPTTSAFGAPTTQGNNIFEALGSTDTGLSFGNLAQTTNSPPNAPKPVFGGSSFMNYRA